MKKQPCPSLVSADQARGVRLSIIASCWHPQIVEALIEGAQTELRRYSLPESAVLRVAGAHEIPALAHAVKASKTCDGIIALGCLIKGETPHFDLLARHVTQRLWMGSFPVGNGVLVCTNLAQARARTHDPHNKGKEAAHAALALACSILALAPEN